MDSEDSTIFLEVCKMSEQLKDKNAYESVSKDKKVFYKELFALAMFVSGLLMRIYTPDGTLIEMGASYLRIVSFFYLCGGITQCYYLVMKMEGKAAKSVMISVVTLVIDMVVDFFPDLRHCRRTGIRCRRIGIFYGCG